MSHRCSAILTASAAVCLLLGAAAPAFAADPRPADVVYMNGKVFTANGRSAVVQAFAVKGERFVATGTSAQVHRYVGPATKVVDLAGHLVTPGLADGHFHNEGGGPGIDLSQARTLSDLLSTVASAAKETAPGELIVSNSDWH